MKGVYQHCAEKHLHRYLSEFDFRYSNRVALGVDDAMRADKALQGIKGKTLDLSAASLNRERLSRRQSDFCDGERLQPMKALSH